MNALQKLDARWEAGGRICVGLDSRYDQLPKMFQHNGAYLGMKAFNIAIIRATKDLVLAYKLNLAPYLKHGPRGLDALIDTLTFIREQAPDVLTILDCKFGDALDDINADYAEFAFEVCGADAMTAQVYAGGDAAKGFTKYKDKLIFFLCKTSNLGSGEFQNLPVAVGDGHITVPLYHLVLNQVGMWWNGDGNCALVVGATAPRELKEVRGLAGNMPILAPGIGKQAGNLEDTLRAGAALHGRLIINESRSIIFASSGEDFAEAARQKLLARTSEVNAVLERMAA